MDQLTWHDAAQARLVSLGASAANASLVYSAGCSLVLLDSALVPVAETNLPQGVAAELTPSDAAR